MFQGQSPVTPLAYFNAHGESHFFLKRYETISSPTHSHALLLLSISSDYYFLLPLVR